MLWADNAFDWPWAAIYGLSWAWAGLVMGWPGHVLGSPLYGLAMDRSCLILGCPWARVDLGRFRHGLLSPLAGLAMGCADNDLGST
jgi:hypothetical protein